MRTNRLLRLLIGAAFVFSQSLALADEITVPDVSGFNTPKAMKAAGPDMEGVILATKIAPPDGSTKLFAYQEPAANTKAPRGSILKIYIYQSLAAPARCHHPPPLRQCPISLA